MTSSAYRRTHRGLKGLSRALAGRVDCEGLILIVVMPLRMRLVAGLLALLAPLVLLLGLLGLAVKPRIFIENPNPCTIVIVPGSVAIAYRTSHRQTHKVIHRIT
jgi:hypothetical protein